MFDDLELLSEVNEFKTNFDITVQTEDLDTFIGGFTIIYEQILMMPPPNSKDNQLSGMIEDSEMFIKKRDLFAQILNFENMQALREQINYFSLVDPKSKEELVFKLKILTLYANPIHPEL